MMDRRVFLKLTGLLAAASAFEALPVSAAGLPEVASSGSVHATTAVEPVRDLVGPSSRTTVTRLAVRGPGEYRITGLVRLEAPTVAVTGISNTQHISWSGVPLDEPMVVSFTSFEQYDRAGMTPDIVVQGGQLESISIVPVEYQ